MADALSRILRELRAHPTDKEGYVRADFETLTDSERDLLIEPFLAELTNGDSTAVEPLQWLLRERYVTELEKCLSGLKRGEPGLVFLPHWLYAATGDRNYLGRMMAEIIRADPSQCPRTHALGGYLRKWIGKDPMFWDFCRYLIVYDPDPSMKKTALLWLAHEKNYPLRELTLDAQLSYCLDGMTGPDAPTASAIGILDRLHQDSGSFKL